MGTLTCDPLPNWSPLSQAVSPGSSLPNATPTPMHASTHTVRYRSKNANRLGSKAGKAAWAAAAEKLLILRRLPRYHIIHANLFLRSSLGCHHATGPQEKIGMNDMISWEASENEKLYCRS